MDNIGFFSGISVVNIRLSSLQLDIKFEVITYSKMMSYWNGPFLIQERKGVSVFVGDRLKQYCEARAKGPCRRQSVYVEAIDDKL